MMRVGKPSLETTPRALVPRALLKATLLSCCRLRGVSTKEKDHHVTYLQLLLHIGTGSTLTFEELQAAVRGRAHTRVVNGFFVQVISSIHVPAELHKKLYQIGVLCFSCMMKSHLMELGSVHICP